MKPLPDDVLEEILGYALEDNPAPFNLMCCRRFRDACYRVAKGLPFRFPTESRVFTKYFAPKDWDAENMINPDREYFLRRVFAGDFAFVKHAITTAPNFVNSCLYFPFEVRYRRRNILGELQQRYQAAMFQTLVNNLKIDILSDQNVFWNMVGTALCESSYSESASYYWHLSTAKPTSKGIRLWEDYVRPCIFHNVKHGFYIERSGCVGGSCGGDVPDVHRARTLIAILKFDDLELFDVYLAQRVRPDRSRGDQTPRPYHLGRLQTLFCLFKPERIIRAHPELFDLRQIAQSQAWLRRDDNLEWCLVRSLDLHRIEVLRLALANKKVLCAQELLSRYSYNITRQDYQHLCHKISALGLNPELLKATVRGKVYFEKAK